MVEAAAALKVALVAPAAAVTNAGTVSEVLLLASVTTEPPAGAVWVRVTVQVLTAFGPRLVGLQATPEANTVATMPFRTGKMYRPDTPEFRLWLTSELGPESSRAPLTSEPGSS